MTLKDLWENYHKRIKIDQYTCLHENDEKYCFLCNLFDPLDFIKNTYIGCDIYDPKYYGFKNGSTSTEEQRNESVEPSE